MSANADDLRFFHSALLGRRIRLGVDTTAGGLQTADAHGAIPPGRYLVQGVGLGANSMKVVAAPFVSGATLSIAIVAAPAAGVTDLDDGILLTSSGASFFLHVRAGVNDRLAAIMSAGTATLEMLKQG